MEIVNLPVHHLQEPQQPNRTARRRPRDWTGRTPMFLLLQCLATAIALGQVRISEFLASNARSYPDIVDFSDYPDWIELENTTDQSVPQIGRAHV